jgi:hypothetical protein
MSITSNRRFCAMYASLFALTTLTALALDGRRRGLRRRRAKPAGYR